MEVDCLRWGLLGVFFRGWASSAVFYHSLKYFNLYGRIAQFSLINASILLFGGVVGNLSLGIFCDKMEPKNLKTKSYVLTVTSISAGLFFFLIYFPMISFWFALIFYFIEIAVCESFFSPLMSLMQQVTPPDCKGTISGLITGIFQFAGLICQICLIQQLGS